MSEHGVVGELGVGKVLRIAGRAYRRWFWRISLTAAVVFGLAAVLTTTVDLALEAVAQMGPSVVETMLVLYAALGRFGGMVALVFYAGFLDLYVGDALYEGRTYSLGTVLRKLPWRRLVVADVIFVAATELGALLFVLPGLLVFTLYALTGPLIIVEGHGIRPAFKRSRILVARHFWLVCAVVTLPAFVEGFIEHAIHAAFGLERFWGYVLVSAVVGSVVGAFVGLMEVIITRELTILWPRPS